MSPNVQKCIGNHRKLWCITICTAVQMYMHMYCNIYNWLKLNKPNFLISLTHLMVIHVMQIYEKYIPVQWVPHFIGQSRALKTPCVCIFCHRRELAFVLRNCSLLTAGLKESLLVGNQRRCRRSATVLPSRFHARHPQTVA